MNLHPALASGAPPVQNPGMTTQPAILCIGAVLWDLIGHADGPVHPGDDLPGRITRRPGGVALNIARALCAHGLAPGLLSAIGDDAEGRALCAACAALGIETSFLHRVADLPTGRYMAVEGANGLIAAIADARALDAAGRDILAPLADGRLGQVSTPYPGVIVLDGNLGASVIREIAQSPLFARAELRVAAASGAKAERIAPMLGHPAATLYLNRQEAARICAATFDTARAAAAALLARGAHRVLVTDGDRDVTLGTADGMACFTPPSVRVARVTGAGDTFVAAHIAAELRGAGSEEAVSAALAAAARHISERTPE
ncbi:PfkB family carbohydrate kinase [Actibacterium sp.]|jgi:sugar/nucleoside kinase (ribokinase family)|uniref:PfkB family carbohydrate kinase n=1 Tax=Actibacterium sp. TaxID=1872125 RepID=UPI00257DD76C|nr:PfkB family carbohydrate kinase [Actibacterium sp.]